MNSFSHKDQLHLEAARGWLELGDFVSANDELDEITPELRAHPLVLELRCDIYFSAKKWDHVLPIAETLTKLKPRRSHGWIYQSRALHELKRTQEAYDRLLPTGAVFPAVWMIPYNLARYAAQLGRITDSEEWFKRAMTIDQDAVRQSAIEDHDLDPLWKGGRLDTSL